MSGTTLTWKQTGRAGYDTNGRITSTWDALDHLTGTAYTPASGAPVTQTMVTNPKNWTITTAIDPGHGTASSIVDVNGKATVAQYDPLGRLTKVWLNNRSVSANPDLQYTYTLQSSAPSWVKTQKLNTAGVQVDGYQIYDGLLRLRQTQTPAPVANGGRNVVDTTYDSRGLTVKSSSFWNSAAAPGSTLLAYTDASVPSQHRYTYDNLQRPTVDAFYSNGAAEFQTSTVYDGDRTGVIPPAGGTTTQTLVDARGNTTQLRQYQGAPLSGSYQATNYSYSRLNAMTTVTDSLGNQWSRGFDLRGRVTSSTDPDSGTNTNTYDDASQLLTTMDGRGITLAYAYDNLGRKTDEYQDTTAGTHLANWTYDTLAKGQLTSSTEYRGSNAYLSAVTGYDDAYQPLGKSITIPAAEGAALAGTWTTSTSYNMDGSVASITYPAAAGLGAETVAYGYDAHAYMLTATGADSYLTAASYQPWGDPYQLTLGASAGGKRVRITSDEYADTHRLKNVSVGTEHPGTPGSFDEQLTQAYNWNPAGELTSIDSTHAGATTDSQCFTYDYLQRLKNAWTTTPTLGGCTTTAPSSTATVGGPDAYWQTYSYDDPTGNRTGLTRHGLSGSADTTTSYTYPAAAGTGAHTLTSTATSGASTGSTSYTYLPGGQLSHSTVNGLSTDYTWQAQGPPGTVTVHTVGGDQTTTYLYDADRNEILRDTPTGKTLYLPGTEVTTSADGNTLTGAIRYYTCGGATIASRTAPGVLTWQASDQQGTANIAINATTQASTVRKQDPFGNPRGATVTWPNPHGFVGGTNDEPGGLIHLGARLYDPTVGRFITDDPVTDPKNPQQLNGYAYANNNPITSSDPAGLRTCSGKADCGDDTTNGNLGWGQGTTAESSQPGHAPPTTIVDPRLGGYGSPSTAHDNYKKPSLLVRSAYRGEMDQIDEGWEVLRNWVCHYGALACSLFDHYTDTTGTSYHVSVAFLLQNGFFRNLVNAERAYLIGLATARCTASGAAYCGYKLNSLWRVARLDKSGDNNLHYGLGQIRFLLTGDVDIYRYGDGSIRVDTSYDVNVFKSWNFDAGDTYGPRGILSLDDLAEMPALGMAREFVVWGKQSENYSTVY